MMFKYIITSILIIDIMLGIIYYKSVFQILILVFIWFIVKKILIHKYIWFEIFNSKISIEKFFNFEICSCKHFFQLCSSSLFLLKKQSKSKSHNFI